ncbi:MAG: YggT family protein [Pseudomonadales bacterium]|nr:YggT family protein [Pseudomonadales bacterium]
MNPLVQIGILIIQTAGGLFLLAVLLRFLLQLARADFYNPISQSIAKMTAPLLLPLRRIVPGLFGVDIACLLLALAVQYLTVTLSGLLVGIVAPAVVLLWSLIGMASMVLYIYLAAMIVMIVASWVAPFSRHPAIVLCAQLVQPLCAPIQRVLPSLGGLDLSPIFVFLLINAARILVNSAAAQTGLLGGATMLVPGMM